VDFSRVKLVTHKGCMDGSAAAILFLVAGGKRENIVFCHPSHYQMDDAVKDLMDSTGNPILVVDTSISIELAEQIEFLKRDVTLLDHHKSADDLKKFSWCSVDHSRCGCLMFYDYIYRSIYVDQYTKVAKYSQLICAVDDVDRWQHNIPESKKVAFLHNILGQNLFIDRFLKNPSIEFSDNEKYLLEIDESRRNQYIQEKKNDLVVITKQIDGHQVRIGCVRADNHQSFLGNDICEDLNLNIDIALMIGLHSISLRGSSNCPVDLSALAKKNGGGGHKLAAGCSVSKILGEELLDLIMSKFNF
jgi:oligoribonuclease NrnB/cAMP/cGMP phosphodiesterase (DHH superfamily)